MTALSVISVLLYAIIAAIFYTSVEHRSKEVGFRKIQWTYLDIIAAIFTAPITLMVGLFLLPFVIVGYIIGAFVLLIRVDRWVDSVESFFYWVEDKFMNWKNNSKLMTKLLKPVKRSSENG